MQAAGSGSSELNGTFHHPASVGTAAFAMGLGRLDGVALNELLARSAKDLGEPGRDPVYGWGLLQYTAIPPC